jgi:hypothetical protein
MAALGDQRVGARPDAQPADWSAIIDQCAEPDPWFDQTS